jgi:hypothetical protein
MSDRARISRISEAMPSAFAAAPAECELRPDSKYFQVFLNALKKAL